MYVSAIVLAAGKGLRLGAKIPKPLVKINGQPLVSYCLNTLSRHPDIKEIILVVNPGNLKEITRKIRPYRTEKIRAIVLGGRLRQDSVRQGLAAINPETKLVLIHDAVRPFIHQETISALIRLAKKYGAAIVGVPVKATIKRVVSRKPLVVSVKKTIKRNDLWEIQTPQVFRKDLILEAYRKFGNQEVSDDAALVEKLGKKVGVVRGSYFNLKITTPEDLLLAKAIAEKWQAA